MRPLVVVLVLFAACTPAAPKHRHAQFVPASAGDVVAAVVAHQRASPDRRTVVYVGAPWCEPCRRFHEAAERGELDDVLGDVDLLELNLDDDRARLEQAGYGSTMIPLWVVPDADGRPSARRMEGSIKGPGAVAEITPRLRALLAR